MDCSQSSEAGCVAAFCVWDQTNGCTDAPSLAMALDEDVSDSSGRFTTALEGTAVYVDGVSGKALSFDGATRVALSMGAAVRAESFSVAMWTKTVYGGGLFSLTDSGGANPRQLGVSGMDLKAETQPSPQISSSWEFLDDGNWHYVVYTYGPTVGERLFKDGRQLTWWEGNDGVPSAVGEFLGQTGYLGWTEDHGYFTGEVDDVKVFVKELSLSDVNVLYNTVLPGPIAHPFPMTNPNVKAVETVQGKCKNNEMLLLDDASLTLEACANLAYKDDSCRNDEIVLKSEASALLTSCHCIKSNKTCTPRSGNDFARYALQNGNPQDLDMGFCTSTHKCSAGQGGCTSNEACAGSLVCHYWVAGHYGLSWQQQMNVCGPPGYHHNGRRL